MGEALKRGRAKTNNPGGSKMMQRIKCKELFAVIIVIFFLNHGTLFAQEQGAQEMRHEPVAIQEAIQTEAQPAEDAKKEEIKSQSK